MPSAPAVQVHLPQITNATKGKALQFRFRVHLLAMRFWAGAEAFAQRRYRLNQASALNVKRRLDNRSALQTHCCR